eukprot:jgi/Ulvmu1/7770/UM039_0079.1
MARMHADVAIPEEACCPKSHFCCGNSCLPASLKDAFPNFPCAEGVGGCCGSPRIEEGCCPRSTSRCKEGFACCSGECMPEPLPPGTLCTEQECCDLEAPSIDNCASMCCEGYACCGGQCMPEPLPFGILCARVECCTAPLLPPVPLPPPPPPVQPPDEEVCCGDNECCEGYECCSGTCRKDLPPDTQCLQVECCTRGPPPSCCPRDRVCCRNECIDKDDLAFTNCGLENNCCSTLPGDD